MCCCSVRTRYLVLIGFGVVFCVLGLTLALLWQTIFTALLQWQLALSPSSMSFDMWKKPPIPIYLDIYVYNMTNADEFKEKGWSVKPKLEELGPYVYREEHGRVNLIWNENGTLTYNQTRTWYFEPEMTKGSLQDKITNINPIIATIASMVRLKHPVIQLAVNWLMKNQSEPLLFTYSVEEQLFSGIDNGLLTLVQGLAAPGVVIPFDKFAWFYDRNGSATFDGVLEMWTGKKDLENMGMLVNWNYKSDTENLTLFQPPCSQINGTSSGELFWPLGVPPPETLEVFSPDICSTIPIMYQGPVENFGIEGARYMATNRSLDNGTFSEKQSCYAKKGSEEWLPHGLRNVSACRWGAPAYFSLPHLLLADKQLLDDLEPGSQVPDPDKHQMIVELEPITGIPMRADAKGQLNLRIQKVDHLDQFKDAHTFYWPVIWFTQRAELSEDLSSMLKILLIAQKSDLYIMWPMFGLGILLTAIGGVLLTLYKKRPPTEDKSADGVFVIFNDSYEGPNKNSTK